MRIKTIAGLTLAGAAATVAVALGGAAYAEGQDGTGRVTSGVTADESGRTTTSESGTGGSATPLDCPEKNGPAAGGGSGSAPATGQPESPAESL
jgi:hypothetical protein